MYTGVKIRCWGGYKISNVCAILDNNSAFESSRRDLCFGAIITLKENKFEKYINSKVFYPPKSCRFFNFCSFFRLFFGFQLTIMPQKRSRSKQNSKSLSDRSGKLNENSLFFYFSIISSIYAGKNVLRTLILPHLSLHVLFRLSLSHLFV